MSVYVDELRDYGPKGKWCHMWSDHSDQQLDDFASGGLGLSKDKVHVSRGLSGEFRHYDLTPSKRQLALACGARFMPLKDWIRSRIK